MPGRPKGEAHPPPSRRPPAGPPQAANVLFRRTKARDAGPQREASSKPVPRQEEGRFPVEAIEHRLVQSIELFGPGPLRRNLAEGRGAGLDRGREPETPG